MEEKKIIKLKYPVEIKQEDGSTKIYDEVKIGRLKNKHLKAFPKDFMAKKGSIPLDKLPGIIAVITDLPEAIAEELDVTDTFEIAGALESFFVQSQMGAGKE